jgi:hypothetical protein
LTATLLPLHSEELEVEFLDTLAYLASQSARLEWEALVAKASNSGLDEADKLRLNELAKEKANKDAKARDSR